MLPRVLLIRSSNSRLFLPRYSCSSSKSSTRCRGALNALSCLSCASLSNCSAVICIAAGARFLILGARPSSIVNRSKHSYIVTLLMFRTLRRVASKRTVSSLSVSRISGKSLFLCSITSGLVGYLAANYSIPKIPSPQFGVYGSSADFQNGIGELQDTFRNSDVQVSTDPTDLATHGNSENDYHQGWFPPNSPYQPPIRLRLYAFCCCLSRIHRRCCKDREDCNKVSDAYCSILWCNQSRRPIQRSEY